MSDHIRQAPLRGAHKRELSDGPLLAVLLGALAVFWCCRVRTSTLVWLALCGGWLLLSRFLYDRAGLVLRLLWIPVGVTILYVGCIALNYVRSVLEKRRITAALKRHPQGTFPEDGVMVREQNG